DPLERLANFRDGMLKEVIGRDGLAIGNPGCDDPTVGDGASRTRDHTLAAGDARRASHRYVEVEGNPRSEPLAHPADDVVLLDCIAAAHAPIAEDARVVVDGNDDR